MDSTPSAVVTGAARGIGRAVAEQLVRRGYAVVVTDVDGSAARRTADEIGARTGLVQDVRDAASHRQVLDAALEHGPLAVWVNNAGVGDDGTLVALTEEQVDRLVDVNLRGVIHGMRAALQGFGSGPGDIVNIGSLSGLGPVPGLSVYAATKAAVVSLTGSVHAETPRRIRVHALCPDGVATELVATMDPRGRARKLVQSRGSLLSAESVANHAVAMIGTRRVVRTVPGWRGALLRGSALAPSLSTPGQRLFLWLGHRATGKTKSP